MGGIDIGMRATCRGKREDTGLPLPLQFLAAWSGTWVCRTQARQIEYLAEQAFAAKRHHVPRFAAVAVEMGKAVLGNATGDELAQLVGHMAG